MTVSTPPEHRPIRLQVRLVPRPHAYDIPLLLDVNLLVYLAMALTGAGWLDVDADHLLGWGAIYAPVTHGLSLWRLIAFQFVHIGALHLAANLYALLITGLMLRQVLPNWRLLATYIVCGIGSGLACVLFDPEAVTAGASGSIMGFCGVLAALWALKDPRVAHMRPMIVNIMVGAVGLTLVYGLIVRNVSNIGHVGGLLTGLVVGVAVNRWGAMRGWR